MLRAWARQHSLVIGIVTFFIAVVAVVYQQGQSEQDAQTRARQQGELHAYHQELKQRAATVQGCIRTNNGVRQIMYDFLTSAIDARAASAAEETGAAKATDLQAAKQYKRERRAAVLSVADHPQTKDSPLLNCADAYPEPVLPEDLSP